MTRFIYPAVVLALSTARLADAQPADLAAPRADIGAEVSSFDQLRTADSPAFVILGVSPTEIQRPSTPRGFIVALGGFVAETGIAVPRDLALEVSPYWLFSHPDLSVTDYRSEHLMRPLRTLSLSIGTKQTRLTTSDAAGAMIDRTDSNIGVGFRTMLFQAGRLDDCTSAANAAGVALAQSVILSEAEKAKLAAEGDIGTPKYNAAFEKLVKDKVDATFRTDKCVALVASTAGFSIDLAGAIDVRAADSKLTSDATSLAGYALWTDLAYDLPRLSLAGMARLTTRNDEMDSHSMLDTGIRGIYKSKSYAISAEALLRHRFESIADATTYKLDVAVEYQISADTWLSLTFGKDFAVTAGDAGTLFSLANIQWSIGKPSI
jgi:hypothetical protein